MMASTGESITPAAHIIICEATYVRTSDIATRSIPKIRYVANQMPTVSTIATPKSRHARAVHTSGFLYLARARFILWHTARMATSMHPKYGGQNFDAEKSNTINAKSRGHEVESWLVPNQRR